MILKAIEGNLSARLSNKRFFLLYSDFFYIDAVLNTVKDKGTSIFHYTNNLWKARCNLRNRKAD